MIIFIGYSVHFLDILGEYLVYCQYEFSNLKILYYPIYFYFDTSNKGVVPCTGVTHS